MIIVYICKTEKLNLNDCRLCNLVEKGRLQKAMRYVNEAARKNCICAYLLLCLHLKRSGAACKPELKQKFDGKPYIESGQEFSFSHSGDYALCAVSQLSVGADIEMQRNLNETVVKRIIKENDNKVLSSVAVFSAKEAYLKLTGEGLLGIDSVQVDKNCVRNVRTGDAANLFYTQLDKMNVSVCFYENTGVELVFIDDVETIISELLS